MTIRELRDRTGLSQSGFSRKFGIPVATVQHWEQGVSSPPSYVPGLIEKILDYEQGRDGHAGKTDAGTVSGKGPRRTRR